VVYFAHGRHACVGRWPLVHIAFGPLSALFKFLLFFSLPFCFFSLKGSKGVFFLRLRFFYLHCVFGWMMCSIVICLPMAGREWREGRKFKCIEYYLSSDTCIFAPKMRCCVAHVDLTLVIHSFKALQTQRPLPALSVFLDTHH
jgi:hypothetical protein